MLIRPAVVGDGPAVLGLVQAMGGHDEILSEPDAPATFAAALVRPEIRVLVADDGGAVVGYAELHARPSVVRGCREGWLAALVVASDRRGQGVGTALLDVVERQARALGCRCVVLESSTWRDRAHGFYRRHGFGEHPPAARFVRPVAGPRPSAWRIGSSLPRPGPPPW